MDQTPNDDSEFFTPGNQGEQNRLDLLTVLEHEVGHLLGHEHEEGGIMSATLTAGTRLSLQGSDLNEIWWLGGLPGSSEKSDPVISL